jgi:4-hydroxy-tetrahydrodipicolinate synthase
MTGRFGSVVTAMVTPFRQDHALDIDRAQELASWLVDNGSDAVVVAGSTGESPTITYKEKSDLFSAVGEAIRDRGKLICGTGTYSTAETLELTQAAEDASADGLLVVTPYYNKPPQRGLIAHFEHVADATDLPIIAYNIPGRTATRIEHDTLLRLAERPNIVAVKDSTGDFQGISRLIAEVPEGFEVYSGDDWATFGYVCLGAVGVVSVASHLVGAQIRQMIDLIETGDVPAARKIHEGLSQLFNALFVTSNPIPLKAALQMVGRPCGEPRLPLVPATLDERERVRKALEDAGLLG